MTMKNEMSDNEKILKMKLKKYDNLFLDMVLFFDHKTYCELRKNKFALCDCGFSIVKDRFNSTIKESKQ